MQHNTPLGTAAYSLGPGLGFTVSGLGFCVVFSRLEGLSLSLKGSGSVELRGMRCFFLGFHEQDHCLVFVP